MVFDLSVVLVAQSLPSLVTNHIFLRDCDPVNGVEVVQQVGEELNKIGMVKQLRREYW